MLKVKVERNTQTGGLCSTFEINGSWFYADLSRTFDHGNECMVFACENEKGEGVDWSELYCKRGIPITSKSLVSCITQFASRYYDGPFQVVVE